MTHPPHTAAAVSAYIGSIVAANALTTWLGLIQLWPTGLMVTAGTFAAAAALILRDAVNETGGWRWVVVAIAAGIVVSYAVADPMIAVASAVAFAGSELVDWAVFTPVRRRSLARAVLASSVVSAPVDTVLFLGIAFGWGAVTWQAVLGQFLVKTAMAALAALIIARRQRPTLRSRVEALRQAVHESEGPDVETRRSDRLAGMYVAYDRVLDIIDGQR